MADEACKPGRAASGARAGATLPANCAPFTIPPPPARMREASPTTRSVGVLGEGKPTRSSTLDVASRKRGILEPVAALMVAASGLAAIPAKSANPSMPCRAVKPSWRGILESSALTFSPKPGFTSVCFFSAAHCACAYCITCASVAESGASISNSVPSGAVMSYLAITFSS